jgi:hypothetical protein
MERTAGFVPGRGEGAGAQHRQRGRRGWGADGDAAPWRACWVPSDSAAAHVRDTTRT